MCRFRDVMPAPSLLTGITHVNLAFMASTTFNQAPPAVWPLFTSVSNIRSKFAQRVSVLVSIGGWGDTTGFSAAIVSDSARKTFAQNIKKMVDDTGADGKHIPLVYLQANRDLIITQAWTLTGNIQGEQTPFLPRNPLRSLMRTENRATSDNKDRGNGADYKITPNSAKVPEIAAYPLLLADIRTALGPGKLLTAAVPGLERDMIAFTAANMPSILQPLNFTNIMTYDLMNRRDTITSHHTGIQASLTSLTTYHSRGVPFESMNLGFAFYIKWFRTDPSSTCATTPLGCKTALLEYPTNGSDTGNSGAFAWSDPVPPAVAPSYARAIAQGTYDPVGGGQYFWDAAENIFWTWDTPDAIAKKFPTIMGKEQMCGVFAWGLGEDAPKYEHLSALTGRMKGWGNGTSAAARRV